MRKKTPKKRAAPEEAFYLLWNRPPRIRFTDIAEARKVARRLAVEQGAEVFILRAVGVMRPAATPVVSRTLR